MDVTDLVTQQDAKQAEFEVDDKSGVRLVAKHDGKVLADLIVGKGVGAGTMVRPAGTNDVWRASGITKFIFDKGPTDWRDKSITTFPPAEAEKLDVAGKDGAKISLKKTGTKAGERGQVGRRLELGEDRQARQQRPERDRRRRSANWKANDFADGVDAWPQAGLDAPALTVTVGLKGGKSVTALIGSKKGDGRRYVKKADAPQIFLVKKFNLDRIDKRPMDFRDKTLCDLAAADLDRDLRQPPATSRTRWSRTATTGRRPSRPSWRSTRRRSTPIAGAFKDWKATGFADDQSLKDNGLAKPKAVISAKSKGSKSSAPACLVRVGDETSDKVSYFVARAKSPDVYLAPKWAVDRILVKPDDLKKAGRGHDRAPSRPSRRASTRREAGRRQEVAPRRPSVTRRGARPASRGGG